ncbi:MAG TPA: hypothetical protein VLQ92_07945, partial [Candidatus Limnocylindrales bacterium]|nr:hypothetical protein [Candidatus Limnocylindrales bacterium]
MSELMRRAAPGLALAGAALATVWLFDPALHAEMTTTAAASPTDSETPADSDGSTDSGDTTPAAPEDSTDTGDSDDSAVEAPAPTT